MKVTGSTLTGPARLFLVIIIAWIAGWGGFYLYAHLSANKAHAEASVGIDNMEKHVAAGREQDAQRMGDAIERSFAIRDRWDDWTARIKLIAPIGLLVIVVGCGAGWWVYRGFRNPAIKDG